MIESKKIARMAGWLYLLVIVCAGFSQGVVRESVFVAGDAAATAQNIMQNEALFRAGLITDLLAFSADVAISILFYLIFRSLNQPLAMIMAAFRLLAHPEIGVLNLLNHYAALRVLQNPTSAEVLSTEALSEFSLFFMEAHHFGYLLAGVLFGFHCLLLGYLLYRSGFFPKLLGVLLVLSSAGYFTESFGFIMLPEWKSTLVWIVGLTAGIGEVSLCLYLIIKGQRTIRMTD